MPSQKTTLVFLGYRKPWEVNFLRERAAANVEVIGLEPDASATSTMAACATADVLIPWKIRLTPELVARSPQVKLVQALSAGVDYLPLPELAERSIMVANNCGANAVAVAEVTIFLIVAVCRQLQVQMNQLYDGGYQGDFFDRWEEFHELTGARVGIVGFGPIGTAVAHRLGGWNCDVVYHDIADVSRETEAAARARRLPFDELLQTADIVTLHVPLTAATRGMISDRELKLMKPTAVLINTTRGPVVDEAALVRALDAGQIAGAGLDVTEVEPIAPDNALLNRKNVVLTPHLAGLSIEARRRALEFAVENTNRLASGEKPLAVVGRSYL